MGSLMEEVKSFSWYLPHDVIKHRENKGVLWDLVSSDCKIVDFRQVMCIFLLPPVTSPSVRWGTACGAIEPRRWISNIVASV